MNKISLDRITPKPRKKYTNEKRDDKITFFSVCHNKLKHEYEKNIESLVEVYEKKLGDFVFTYSGSIVSDIKALINDKYKKYRSKFIEVKDHNTNKRNIRLEKYIDNIRTEYVMLIDGDDYINSDILSKLLPKLKEDFIILNGKWLIINENDNIGEEEWYKDRRNIPGVWVQSYIFSKRSLQKAINSYLWTIIGCYSISDAVLGLVLLECSDNYIDIFLDSPYIHRENSKSSINNAGYDWRSHYSDVPQCKKMRTKYNEYQLKGLDDTLNLLSDLFANEVAIDKTNQYIDYINRDRNR